MTEKQMETISSLVAGKQKFKGIYDKLIEDNKKDYEVVTALQVGWALINNLADKNK